ncbi:hypothetical protein DFI02_102113 [Rhizobium sp. PP-F2F-G20b]|nr:hypothetical protein DFI02_102113 [Rhizobium sp. PP-F2F-G20b]
MIYLLDVNVLIALLDAGSPFHSAAHEWISDLGKDGWATCPITENGVIRILSNRTYVRYPGSAIVVSGMIDMIAKRARRHSWADDVSLANTALFSLERITHHNQITDTYLLGLATSKGGRLATFDRHIDVTTVIGGAEALHLIPS